MLVLCHAFSFFFFVFFSLYFVVAENRIKSVKKGYAKNTLADEDMMGYNTRCDMVHIIRQRVCVCQRMWNRRPYT